MPAHPNAHILQRLAELAQTTVTPWEHFEWEVKPGIWHPCSDSFSFACTEIEVRERILNPITINGKTLEGPLREAPEPDAPYWLRRCPLTARPPTATTRSVTTTNT